MSSARAAFPTRKTRSTQNRSDSGHSMSTLPTLRTRPLPGTVLCMVLVALPLVLGGGGTSNPQTEMVLEVLTALVVIALTVAPEWQDGLSKINRAAWLLAGLVLLIPIVQLIPLPPTTWQSLPGRAIEAQSLAAAQAEHRWMPLSMAPARTFASLLAMISAVFIVLQVSRLSIDGRNWICGTIVLIGVLSLILGALQLSHTGGADWSLYDEFSKGYLVGFQANRNAEADVLLIVTLAVGTLIAVRGGPGRSKFSRAVLLSVGTLPFLVSVFMTGSRTGIALVGVVVLILAVMFWPIFKPGRRALVALLAILGGVAAFSALLAQLPAVNKTIARFAFTREARWGLWADTIYAARQVWPFGSGMGTIVPMLEAAERLDEVDPTRPVRTHNDWLELILESGLLGLVILVVLSAITLVMVYRAVKRSTGPSGDAAYRAQTLFAGGVLLVIGLHSVVDYPLRSMALAALTAVAVAFLIAPAALQQNQR